MSSINGTAPLPEMMETAQVCSVVHLAAFTVNRMCRDGKLPGAVKVSRNRWRIPRSAVEALLAGETPAQRRAEVLDRDTLDFLRKLAREAGRLSDEQKDVIRSAFRDST